MIARPKISRNEWKPAEIGAFEVGNFALLSCPGAYQGFASGDAEADAFAIRKFLDDGHSLLLAQSFAKNFGLYGERVGTLSVVCKDTEEVERVMSQLKRIIRPMYSSPPIHGALIVTEVLSDDALRALRNPIAWSTLYQSCVLFACDASSGG